MRPTLFFMRHHIVTESKVPLKPKRIVEDKLLRNHLDTEKDGCLTQLTTLLACIKEDVSGKQCGKEFAALTMCFEKYQQKQLRAKEERKRLIPAPNAKVLTQQQTQYLLKKYPLV